MKTRYSNRHNSGQVLIIASLLVTMLLLSTALYVAETQRNALVYQPGADAMLSLYKQGIRHTMISALVNISNGGTADVLAADLNQFKAVATNHSYGAIFKMEFTPLNTMPYQNGVWISWGSSGKGITSAYSNFSLDSSGTSAIYHSEYSVNVTSEIDAYGYYTVINESLKQASLTCTIRNEGEPALAQNFTVYYEKDGLLSPEEWIQVASPNVIDYGNGTYRMSFTAETLHQDDLLLISVSCHDLRHILIETKVTCVQV